MSDFWYKLCPRCNNYVKKNDPQETGVCNVCGWEEYAAPYYCEVFNRYCNIFRPVDANEALAPEQVKLTTSR